MPLSAGTRLGPYEILSPIGAGGMGEVYRARDTRLDRTVAIKVLPAHLSTNPDLRARFEREAKAISALQHSNICVLHDVGQEAGVDFLVMEYLEGETLAARLARKPLLLDESLRIGIEMAHALDAAHRHGLTHRDLKPGNIMLTKSGAKLMDFGLAKPNGLGTVSSMSSAASTMTSPVSPATAAGTVVGTLQYMSPEQLQSQPADARSDLFALGATLYEMLTGKRAFEGKSQISVASAILEKDPVPVSSLQPLTPPSLERVINKCLAKDPAERWQCAHDLAFELKWIAEGGGVPPGTSGASRRLRDLTLYGALAIALLVATVLGLLYWRVVGVPAQTVTAEIAAPSKTRFSFFGPASGAPVLSPDGRVLAFCAMDHDGKGMLWVRSIDSGAARPLPGTEGANDPFWSVDGKGLGFFADSKLKTIRVSGGSVIAVSAAPVEGGGSWNREGSILFVPDYAKGICKTAAGGGNQAIVVAVNTPKVNVCSYPKFLPDGKHFLYLASGGDPAAAGIYFASLDGKENRLLAKSNSAGIYASGFLLYVRDRALVAQAFDPTRGQLRGDSYPLVEDIPTSGGTGVFAASENGNLVYLEGTGTSAKRLTWFDRAGKILGTTGEAADYFDLRLSPDGRMLAANAGYPAGSSNSEIWVDELPRNVRTRLTIDPDTDHGIPVWSADNSKIAFAALRGTARVGIYEKSVNGAGNEKADLGIRKRQRADLAHELVSRRQIPPVYARQHQSHTSRYMGAANIRDTEAPPLVENPRPNLRWSVRT
jgi:eukaryotic-like serine/threonine-protein kinase